MGGSRRCQWKSGDGSGRFWRVRAEGDGSGRCRMGWRRLWAAWIGECGGGGGGSTVSRALLAGNGLAQQEKTPTGAAQPGEVRGSGARQWPSPWRAHRWRGRVASSDGAKRGRFWEDQGRTRWFGPGARHLSAQVAGAGVRRRQWTGCREAGG